MPSERELGFKNIYFLKFFIFFLFYLIFLLFIEYFLFFSSIFLRNINFLPIFASRIRLYVQNSLSYKLIFPIFF